MTSGALAVVLDQRHEELIMMVIDSTQRFPGNQTSNIIMKPKKSIRLGFLCCHIIIISP